MKLPKQTNYYQSYVSNGTWQQSPGGFGCWVPNPAPEPELVTPVNTPSVIKNLPTLPQKCRPLAASTEEIKYVVIEKPEKTGIGFHNIPGVTTETRPAKNWEDIELYE